MPPSTPDAVNQASVAVPPTENRSLDLAEPITGDPRGLILATPDEVPPHLRARAVAERWLANYKGHTLTAYRRDLGQWFRVCATVLEIDPLTANRAAVAGYVTRLSEERSAATAARHASALAGFYKYAEQEEFIDRSPAAHVKRPKVSADSQTLGLDRGEARRLIAAARADTKYGNAGKSAALITLLLHDGLRISETLGADIDDMSWTRGHCTLKVTRKGGAVKEVVLNPATCDAIDNYLANTGRARGESSGPLFTTKTGARLTVTAAARIITRCAQAAEIEAWRKITPHSLRHTFVTLAREAGVPLEDVQDAAGHADPRTTRRYDRGRHNLDRHPSYALGAFLAD